LLLELYTTIAELRQWNAKVLSQYTFIKKKYYSVRNGYDHLEDKRPGRRDDGHFPFG
jgi:thiamine kinase-like enzyme